MARFDPSKGIPEALESYRLLRERLRREGVPDSRAPQLVLAGHGAVDDVQGAETFAATLKAVRERYPELAGDIKLAALPASDQALNAVLSGARFVLQLSRAEGYEIKVSETLDKGLPVVGSRIGGIALQIADGLTGYLVGVGRTRRIAARMHALWTDPALRARMGSRARGRGPLVHTVHNALRWLVLARGAFAAPGLFPEPVAETR